MMNPESVRRKKGGSCHKTRTDSWTDTMDAILLGILKEEHEEGYFYGDLCPSETWERINVKFNQRTKKDVNVVYAENRLDFLKKTFYLYQSLAIRSGWRWDHQNNIPTPKDSAMWEKVIAVNKDYAKIKDKPFSIYDDMKFLFSENTTTGRRAHTTVMSPIASDEDNSDDDTKEIDLDVINLSQNSTTSSSPAFWEDYLSDARTSSRKRSRSSSQG